MGFRRRSRPRHRVRRLVVLSALVTALSAYRQWALARSEQQYPELVAPPSR